MSSFVLFHSVRGRRDCDCMVVGFTCAVSAYYH